MELRTVENIPLKKGSKVLLRADFDVTTEHGEITDDFRMSQVRDTARAIIEQGGILRVVSHLGRPGGKKDPKLSLHKLLPSVEEILSCTFRFVADPFAEDTKKELYNSSEHLLFENIRFWEGEEKNDERFAKELASWGDYFVNEAFAVAHRNHASVALIPRFILGYAGLRFAKEVSTLARVFENPALPLIAVLGGEKIETKLPMVERFLEKGGSVLVGGLLMNTLLAAKGFDVGRSPVDAGFLASRNVFVLDHNNLILPRDAVVGKDVQCPSRVCSVQEINEEETIFDIGPETVRQFSGLIRDAGTIVWNGPLGQFEYAAFMQGTLAVAESICAARGLSIVGGGHTISAIRRFNLFSRFPHVSAGGGAMLEFLAGRKLPGIEALKN